MTGEACPRRAISVETTGDDEETARIVAIALVSTAAADRRRSAV
ncbi:hypothetical protein [Amycolatopsis sp. cmx-4-61]